MEPHGPASRIHAHHHAVQFYGDEHELCRTIGAFLVDGLIAGQPAVVIATPPHSTAIASNLTERFIDVARAREAGDLVMLDAGELLATFMSGGAPDPALFRHNVGGLFEQALRGRERTPVRAYGEMVDVLWKRGQTEAAVRLEVLWNELATTHTFSLLCGYAIGNFYKQTSKLEEVVQQHTHAIGLPTNVVSMEAGRPRRK